MKFVKVDHGLNSSYSVEDIALKQMVGASVKAVKGVTLVDSRVQITKNNQSFQIFIKIIKKKKDSFKNLATTITYEIETNTKALIGSTPENISISFEEGK